MLQVVIFFQNLALLNSFVSIMLPFSVTSVKALHTWFAEQSLAVYHEETDTRMAVRSAALLLPSCCPTYCPPAALLDHRRPHRRPHRQRTMTPCAR